MEKCTCAGCRNLEMQKNLELEQPTIEDVKRHFYTPTWSDTERRVLLRGKRDWEKSVIKIMKKSNEEQRELMEKNKIICSNYSSL